MKKFLFALMVGLLFWGRVAVAESENDLSPNEIYIFTQSTCSHCHAALRYLEKNYPDLKVRNMDISNAKNAILFYRCAAKFKVESTHLGTPLFCMGSHYILGWGSDEQKQFESYVKEFLPE